MLEPTDYGAIVGKVGLQSDQPAVALLLATKLSSGVTCAHVAAALARAADTYRATIVEKVRQRLNGGYTTVTWWLHDTYRATIVEKVRQRG